jgi:hypothetical protein
MPNKTPPKYVEAIALQSQLTVEVGYPRTVGLGLKKFRNPGCANVDAMIAES